MASPSVPNGQNSTTGNSIASQMQALSNPNAYQNSAGLLLGVLGTLAQYELQLRRTNAQMRVATTEEQTLGAEMQGGASLSGAVSEAVGDGAEAANSIGGAVYAGSAMKEESGIQEQYKGQIDEKNEQIKAFRSTTGMGSAAELPEGVTKEQHIQNLQQERGDLVNQRDHSLRAHQTHTEGVSNVVKAANMFSKIGTGIAKSQAQTEGTLAQNTSSLAQQMTQDIQSSEKSNDDVAAQALQFNPAQVAVAAVRG